MRDMTTNNNLTMYGTTWCSDCFRTKQFLESKKIPYTYIGIDEDNEAANLVEKLNNGNRSVPTLVFSDNTTLVEPTNIELENKLKSLS